MKLYIIIINTQCLELLFFDVEVMGRGWDGVAVLSLVAGVTLTESDRKSRRNRRAPS